MDRGALEKCLPGPTTSAKGTIQDPDLTYRLVRLGLNELANSILVLFLVLIIEVRF